MSDSGDDNQSRSREDDGAAMDGSRYIMQEAVESDDDARRASGDEEAAGDSEVCV